MTRASKHAGSFPRAVARRRAGPWRSSVVLLCATLATIAPLPAGGDEDSELVARFERVFEQEMAAENVPGAAWAIVSGDQIAGLGAWGHTELNGRQPIDAYTRFRIASLSKGFSGVLAAILAGDGALQLDRRVTELVPSFRITGTQRALTLEDVLGQRSGFVRNAYDNLLEAGISRDEILPRFARLEPLCAPGACYSYQNNVFSLVEDAAERSVGTPWPTLVRQRLFEPLGMVGASVGFDPMARETNRAEPHLKTRGGWRKGRLRPTYYQVASAAGINAGAFDMAQWLIALLGHRPSVVPEQAIVEVARPRIDTPGELRNRYWRDVIDGAWYGLGWRIFRVDSHELLLHGGWVAGYRSEIAFSRELDLGIVILSNAETRAVGALTREFWDLAFDRRIAGAADASLTGSASVTP